MRSDNLQVSETKTASFTHPYPATEPLGSLSTWRSMKFFTLSLLAHAVLAMLFLWRYSAPEENVEKMAGSEGGSMQVMMVPSAIALPETSAELSEQPIPVVQTSIPEPSVTLPSQPTAVIKLPVAEPKPVTVAVEKKPLAREKKPPEKTRQEPRVSQQSQVKPVEKQPPSQTAAREVSDTPSLNSSATSSMSSGAVTAKTGESDSGQAKQGAGSANTQRLKALHRRVNYPARAKSMGVEGKVRVKFDITGSGTVTNIRVLSENPDGVFGDDVMKDMARWRYQTQTSVENQVVSIVFKLDGRIQFDN